MKSFMFLLALGLAFSDKLDRTYLPPPGSKFAGGSPGSIQAPFEVPKEAYLTTLRPVPGLQDKLLSAEDSIPTVGIDRTSLLNGGLPTQNLVQATPDPNAPFTYFQNSYKVPTTTTSYAFTQTTTFPPPGGFETTISSNGFSDGAFNDIQQQAGLNFPQISSQEQNYEQQINEQRQPGFGQPIHQISDQQPITESTQRPGHEYQTPVSNSQVFIDGHPGFNQRPQGLVPTHQQFSSSTVPPTLVNNGFVPQLPSTQNQHLGVQPPRQFTGQPGNFPPNSAPQLIPSSYLPGTSSQYENSYSQPQKLHQGSIPFSKQQNQPNFPQVSYQPDFRPNNGNFENIQGSFAPSSNFLQQTLRQPIEGFMSSTEIPQEVQYGQRVNHISELAPGSRISQHRDQTQAVLPSPGRPGLNQYGQSINDIQGTSPGMQLAQFNDQQPPTQYPGQQVSYPTTTQNNKNQENILSESQTAIIGRPTQTLNQQGFPSTAAPQGISSYPPGPQYGSELGNNQQANIFPGSNIPQQVGNQRPVQFTGQPGSHFSTEAPQGLITYQPGTQLSENNQGNIAPGSNINQQSDGRHPLPSGGQQRPYPITEQGSYNYQPGSNLNGADFGNTQGIITSGVNTPQNRPYPGQQGQLGSNQLNNRKEVPQQFPSTTSRPNTDMNQGLQNFYKPDSTVISSILPPGYSNQASFPSTTPTAFPVYGTDSLIYPTNHSLIPGYGLRPERPQAESDRNAVILNYENILTPEGFAYSFDTSNEIHADESGTAVDGVKATGSYSYIGDDGKEYKVVYSADENGFRPHGDHLPTSPPVPEAIQRVIEQAARDKEAGIEHDGSYDESKYGHENYQGKMNLHPQQLQDKYIVNGANIPNEYENQFNEDYTKMTYPGSTRRPLVTSQDVSNKYENDEQNGQRIPIPEGSFVTGRPNGIRPGYFGNRNESADKLSNQNSGLRIPSRTNDETYVETDDYSEDDIQKHVSTKINPRPGTNNAGKIPTDRIYVEGEEYSKDDIQNAGLPGIKGKTKGGRRPDNSSNRHKVPDKLTSQNKDQNYRLQSTPTKSGERTYIETEDYLKDNIQKPGLPSQRRRPGLRRPIASSMKYSTQRPGISSNKDIYEDDKNTSPISKQNHNFSFNEQTGTADPSQGVETELGYQYIPPQNQFIQGEPNIFPSRISEDASTTSRPTQQTTIQPFMTPNVSRNDEDDSYEDIDQKSPSRKSMLSDKVTSAPTTSQEVYEDNDNENDREYDQDIGDEIINTTRVRPDKPVIQTTITTRPTTNRNLEHIIQSNGHKTTPGDRNRGTQKPSSKPEQKIDIRYPGLENSYGQRISSSQLPSSDSMFSTTQMPTRGSMRFATTKPDNMYFQTTDQSQHPMTDGIDYTTGPKYSSATTRPEFSSSRRPSGRPTPTTPRPGFSGSSGSTFTPASVTRTPVFLPFSTTTKPIINLDKSSTSEFDTKPGTSGASGKPSTAVKYDRVEIPGSLSKRPSKLENQGLNLPSTTYRPNYTFTATGSPLVVDKYGRPIKPQPGFSGSTTYHPDLSTPTQGSQSTNVVSSQLPGSSKFETFKPNEPRFGLPITLQPSPNYGQIQDLTTPSYSGLNGGQTSPYGGQTSTYGGPTSFNGGQTSTEKRVLGEDFSGPKQPQRFDPETGYHY